MCDMLPQNQDNTQRLFRIAWELDPLIQRSRDRGVRSKGQGTRLMPLAEAQALASELNEQYPHITHTVIPA